MRLCALRRTIRPSAAMRRRAPRPSARRRAFTLIETGLAILIIGVGILAMIEAQQAFLQRNAWSTHSSTATFLAGEMRELTRGWPRHDTFSGGLYFEDPDNHTNFRGWGAETGEALLEDFDDLDDLDGVLFGDAPNAPGAISRRLPGPINAFREVIPETSWRGDTAVGQDGQPLSMRGWSQYVVVEKVDPMNYALARADDYFVAAAGGAPEVEVDQFPVRITVMILHQGDLEANATEIARVVWVSPN